MNLAVSLAWQDIITRYRGSVLGPIWITLSMAAMIGGIGVLYAELFGLSVREYLPFIAVGIIVWNIISGVILESCDMYTAAAGLLRQSAIPMTLFLWRVMLRNLIYFAHHVVIVFAVLAYTGRLFEANVPLALVGLVGVLVNVSWVALILGSLASRFRDIPQMVATALQFLFFMTPIIWAPTTGRSRYVAEGNPFYYLTEAVRAPLLDQPYPSATWPTLITMAVIGWAAALVIFTMTRRRIVHYL